MGNSIFDSLWNGSKLWSQMQQNAIQQQVQAYNGLGYGYISSGTAGSSSNTIGIYPGAMIPPPVAAAPKAPAVRPALAWLDGRVDEIRGIGRTVLA